MIKIDKYNYEAFFLDYWENRLDDTRKEQLRQFLEENPELRSEFEAFTGIPHEPDPGVRYPEKSKLKSGIAETCGAINAENYRYFLAASSEGDLDRSQEKNLEEFLQKNPLLRDEQRLYKLARLSPDTNIIYADKERLYRKPLPAFNISGFYHIAAAAALLIIVFGLYQLYLRPGIPPASQDRPDSKALAMKPLAADLKTVFPKPEIIDQSRQSPDPVFSTAERQTEPVQAMPVLAFRTPLATDGTEPTLLTFNMPAASVHLGGGEKTLAGRIISGLFRKVSDRVEPTLATTRGLRDKKMTFWDLADSGISGYNYLTDNDVVLVRTLDEDGRTRKVRLINSEH